MTPTGIKATSTVQSSCYCCPYGYHIDLDFVKYCEELAVNAAQPNARRDRRRKRQSIEVMLGIDDSLPWMVNGHTILNEVSQKYTFLFLRTDKKKLSETCQNRLTQSAR